MIKNYLISALRNLQRQKLFSFINIFGLSLGIACCMLIFLYAKDEISFDHFHEKKHQIYRITAAIKIAGNEPNYSGNTGMVPGPHFKQQLPEIEEYLRLQSAMCDVKKGKDIFEQEALWSDDNFFSVFSFPLLYGDEKTAFREPQSVVISEELALKYFGKKNAVGEILQLRTHDEFKPFVVSAVARNSPQNSSIKIQFILPMKYRVAQDKLTDGSNDSEWMNFFLNTFVVLKPHTDAKKLALKFNQIYLRDAAAHIKEMKEMFNTDEEISYGIQPLLDMHLSTQYPADNGLTNASNPMYSYILVGISILVLLIASINFINLTVARSLKRAKEIGVRKVVGGRRAQLIFQFLSESFLFTFFSFTLALLLVVVSLPFFNTLANKALAFSYLLDSKLIFGYVTLFVITGFLAGFYPALVLSGFNPVQSLYGKMRLAGKNYLSRSLVVFQFVLASFLIIATTTIYSQFNFLLNYDLGYDKTNVLEVLGATMDKAKLETFKNELLKNPGILKASAEQQGNYVTFARVNGETNLDFGYNLIDETYLDFFHLKLVEGRNFMKELPSDSATSVLVNETFVKAAKWQKPLGETVDFFYKNKKYSVVGVIKDFHTNALTTKIRPELFIMDPDSKYGRIFMKLKEGSKLAAMKHVEKTFRSFFPLQPYNASFLDEDLAEQYNSEKKWKQIILFAALLAIFISCIGLFGLAALSAEKRTKEIGIRKVLGASVTLIAGKLSLDFLKLVLIASFISIPIGWWAMNKWLENYPYRISLHAGIFVFTLVLILFVALLTVSYQALRAAIANPVKSLRTE